MPNRAEREYRSMSLLQVRAEDTGADSYVVTGYATTFGEPYLLYQWGDEVFYEIIDRHAFDDCEMDDVIMQYDHMGMVFARTRNGSLKLEIDEHGLKVTADLSLTEESRKLYEAIKAGLVDRMSFGFTVATDGDSYDKETKTDTITKISRLYDVSAVSIPANPGTEISAQRKELLDGEIEKLRAERLAKERGRNRAKALRLRIKLMKLED